MINRAEFVRRWSTALESHSATVFIGAGLSVSAGYPNWRTLLKDIAQELGLDIAGEHDLAAVAQYSVNRSAGKRQKLRQTIIDNFPPHATAPEAFRILARLPLRHVWTSNYDELIETAWRQERKLADVKSQNADIGHEKPWAHTIVYKMHGTVAHPGEVVIAKDDYELYRKVRPAFLQLLAGHLVSTQMLFLGFSFTDPNLTHLFSSIRETFVEGGPTHYAVVRKPRHIKRGRLAKSHKVETIRHNLWIEDLQRYGIECVEIDDYDEIAEILGDVERHLARNSIFVSGSYPDIYDAAMLKERRRVEETAHYIGVEIAKRKLRLVSGFGTVIGGAAIGGVLSVALKETAPNLDRSLLLRPFPQKAPTGIEPAEFQEAYRNSMVSQTGICIFIAGCKMAGKNLEIGTGVLEEFKSAHNAGRICLPIGATGHAAAQIWKEVYGKRESLAPGVSQKHLLELNDHAATPARLAKTISEILDRLSA